MQPENFNFCLFVLVFMGVMLGVVFASVLSGIPTPAAPLILLSCAATGIATAVGVEMSQSYYKHWNKK